MVTREENRSAAQAHAKRCGVRNTASSLPCGKPCRTGQIRENTAFAEKNGIVIVGHYIDKAVSTKINNRLFFNKRVRILKHLLHHRKTDTPSVSVFSILWCPARGISPLSCRLLAGEDLVGIPDEVLGSELILIVFGLRAFI